MSGSMYQNEMSNRSRNYKIIVRLLVLGYADADASGAILSA